MFKSDFLISVKKIMPADAKKSSHKNLLLISFLSVVQPPYNRVP